MVIEFVEVLCAWFTRYTLARTFILACLISLSGNWTKFRFILYSVSTNSEADDAPSGRTYRDSWFSSWFNPSHLSQLFGAQSGCLQCFSWSCYSWSIILLLCVWSSAISGLLFLISIILKVFLFWRGFQFEQLGRREHEGNIRTHKSMCQLLRNFCIVYSHEDFMNGHRQFGSDKFLFGV